MEDLSNYVWASKGGEVKMTEMSATHLQNAHTHACIKEYSYFLKSGFFSDLRDHIEEVAAARGIQLAYPDENHPSKKMQEFFQNLVKTKAMQPSCTASIGNYIGLKQVNADLDI